MSADKGNEVESNLKFDLSMSFTDDLALLRFRKGPLLSFLWDDLSEDGAIKDLLSSSSFRVVAKEAVTYSHYRPVFNNSKSGYPAYCNFEYIDNTKVDYDAGILPATRPIKGLLIETNLEGLEVLDEYYENSCAFHRKVIGVKQAGVDTRLNAFSYFNKPSDFCTYDPHVMRFKPFQSLSLESFKPEFLPAEKTTVYRFPYGGE